jgi:carboxymethylenebutenolidase
VEGGTLEGGALEGGTLEGGTLECRLALALAVAWRAAAPPEAPFAALWEPDARYAAPAAAATTKTPTTILAVTERHRGATARVRSGTASSSLGSLGIKEIASCAMTDAIKAETIRLAGHGGDELEAYFSQPLAEGPYGGLVVIHHTPGYDEATKEITRRIADHGYFAICPNLYSREGIGSDPAEAAAAVRQKGGVPDDQLVGDVDGAVRYLRSLDRSNAKVGTIGYCSGGRQSFLAACSLQLDAAVDCYGAFIVHEPPAELHLRARPIVQLARDLSCPLLGLFGAQDEHPSPEETAALARALEDAGKTFEFHTFENAGHAFFATDRPMYRPEAANRAWPIVWDFFERTLR